jgi:hypothetical protein
VGEIRITYRILIGNPNEMRPAVIGRDIKETGCNNICGLVVRVLDYRSRGPGSIPGTTTFSEN